MNKDVFYNLNQLSPKSLLRITLCLVISLFVSGCYFSTAVRDAQRLGVTTIPWWCEGPPDLTREQCDLFSLRLDIIVNRANANAVLGDFMATGATALGPWPGNSGLAYGTMGTTFAANVPNVLLYDGSLPDSRVVGVAWVIDTGSVVPPAGFSGSRDVWTAGLGTDWWLAAWVIQGYQNHPDVFALSQPCLTAGGSILTATTDACYLQAHTEPFEILVSNDDGVQAGGIDALVEGLYAVLPPEAIIHVVAPSANQSGAGGATSPPDNVVSGSAINTLGGKPATAVVSTPPGGTTISSTPADAVIFALTDQLLTPEVLISGINAGQNYSNIGRVFSGTVGAARAGRSNGVPAIATSQGGITVTPDFPTGVTATLALLEEWRLGRTVNTIKSVLNINTPSCSSGLTPRGTLNTEVKPILEPGDDYFFQNCASVEPVENITNDLEAFNHGFIGITDINRTESLTVTSYNMGLALNFVPYTQERLVANEALLPGFDSDVICFQEVWLPDSVTAIEQALDGYYPHIYIEPPEQVISAGAACTLEEITPFADCALALCPGLSGGALVDCALANCSADLPGGSCLDGLIGAVGIPNVTVQIVLDLVTQPTGKFAFDGSLGLILASKYELQNREFQDFIDDSSGNHRGALYAEIDLNNKKHIVGCTHPTANLEATIAYPASGNFISWEEENAFMQAEMISFANAKAGSNPIFFGGDFNCSIANAGNGVDADFAASCQLWLDDGFSDPGADQLQCTFCETENLILLPDGGTESLFLDHIFVKNRDTTAPIVVDRVFDGAVFIDALNPVSELEPVDAPLLTHPSDHFGVRADISLR
ncbi:MAG: endonuclease/exonuclease/phosphatase family protein [Halioglobus sp.]|nr:endonuclease/exonuclease/phosphatase family protein [Halioglobus sp.]